MFRRLFAVAALVSCAASPVLAQGRQSGGIAGRVSSADGQPLPGASVSVSSPALQGERSAVSDVNGVFRIPGLPPGDYVVTIEMSGMTTVERRATVPLGGDVVIEQSLAVAAVAEHVEVRGARPAAVASPARGVNPRAAQREPV